MSGLIFVMRTTANREDQVMDFVTSNAKKKKLAVYAHLINLIETE